MKFKLKQPPPLYRASNRMRSHLCGRSSVLHGRYPSAKLDLDALFLSEL